MIESLHKSAWLKESSGRPSAHLQTHLPWTTLPFWVMAVVLVFRRALNAPVLLSCTRDAPPPRACSVARHAQSKLGAIFVEIVSASSWKSRAIPAQTGTSQVSFSWSGEGSMV